MIQYIVECIAFQLLFLIVYDLFLRRETFFQWNRLYLITTYILSLLLPWIRVDAFKNTVPEHIMYYPEILMDVNTTVNIAAVDGMAEASTPISWWKVLFYAGTVIAFLFFLIKIIQLYRLRRKGEITHFKDFTRVLVSKSNFAFSFFRTIFLGDQIQEPERQNIVEHELVHIKQRHSLDLLFFELLRIVNWFNPLVYVYQSRISELHEFIADAQVAKTRKKEQYQLLLSQVFQTENISFINHFFKSSLIKKRIVMLQKSKSKKIWGAKYLLLVPMVLCILFYTSSKGQEKEVFAQEQTRSDAELIKEINLKIDRLEEENGFLMIVWRSKEVLGKDIDEDVVLNKEEFFERDLIMARIMEESQQKDNNSGKEKPSIFFPTTKKYNRYASRKKAFQELDKSLNVSFKAYSTNFEVIAPNAKISSKYKIINVENAKDLTGSEIREVNNTMDDIIQNGAYEGIAITDGTIAVQVKHDIVAFNKIKKPKASKTAQDVDEIPFSVVDKVPVFPGCEDADDKKACFREQLQKHIRDNFRYPQSAQKQGIQGRVSILFIIMEDGSIDRIRMRGPSKILEQESERIIKELPKMKPGEHKGKKVRVPFSVPITFKLQTEKDLDPATLKHVRKQLEQMEREAKEKADYGDDVPFSVIDDVPVFPGCEDAADKKACFTEKIQKHIKKHFRYPKEAQAQGIQGRVSVMFTIGKDGSIENIRKRGPSKILEQEAVRIIEELPQMVPGKQKGKSVNVPFSVPITFKLNGKQANGVYNGMDQDSLTRVVAQSIAKLEKEAKEKEDYGDVVPFSVIDDVPVFPGCEDATDKKACFTEMIQKHIRKHFRYPKSAEQQGIQGRVSVMFTIGEEGDINNIRMRGPSKILEQEAARIIKKLPKMVPGKQKGKNVNVPFYVPITFKLNDSKSKIDLAEAMLVTATSKTKNGKKYLSGKVANGELGLPGVNITIKGGNKSVTTNFDGEFTIEIKSGDIVSFQYLGFPKTALVITDKEEYKIKSYK